MVFRVVYHSDPESDLAHFWIHSSDKKSITKAVQRIDQLLASNPRIHGVEVAEELFAIEVPPLKVFFEIHEQTREIHVTGIALLDS